MHNDRMKLFVTNIFNLDDDAGSVHYDQHGQGERQSQDAREN
jgi:hypothetical protein